MTPKRMAEFRQTVEKELALLEGRKALAGYKVDSLVPDRAIVEKEKPETRPAKKSQPRRQARQAARKTKKHRRG